MSLVLDEVIINATVPDEEFSNLSKVTKFEPCFNLPFILEFGGGISFPEGSVSGLPKEVKHRPLSHH